MTQSTPPLYTLPTRATPVPTRRTLPVPRPGLQWSRWAVSVLLCSVALGCNGLGAGAPPDKNGTSSNGDGDGDGDVSTDGDGDGDTTTDTTTEGTTDDPDHPGSPVIPARIRRLTNSEYNASVQALVGTTTTPGDQFPPDMRQQGFTLNEAQRVDPILARQLDDSARLLADEVIAKLDQFAPCPDQQFASCGEAFIDDFGARAYRRPLTPEDKQALVGLFNVGLDGGDYNEAVHLVVRGILQSPGFLYLTEIGDGGSDMVEMTDHEVAASLSYLLTGGPPDEALIAAAQTGNLASAEGRVEQARRLLATAAGQDRSLRIVREWLGIDRMLATAKDANLYPTFDGLRDDMDQETDSFIRAVLTNKSGDVSELLGATFSDISGDLAALYGVSGQGQVDVPDRPGLLNRAAFLSIYGHADENSPIKRGTAVLRRITCEEIELPTNLSVEIIPPPPDPNATTRERYDVHAQDVSCRKCHNKIDPFGFSFEQFDTMGRTQLRENNKDIDSTATIALGADFDGSYASSSDLAVALSQSQDVRQCFARQIFRASVGEASGISAAEDLFVDAWSALDEADQRSLIEILVQLAASDAAVQRSVQ